MTNNSPAYLPPTATEGRRARQAKYYARRTLVDGRLTAPVVMHDASTYTNHGCRCPQCTAALKAQQAANRNRRRQATADNGGIAPVAKHGATTRANWGCRCRTCLDGDAARHRAYSKVKRIEQLAWERDGER